MKRFCLFVALCASLTCRASGSLNEGEIIEAIYADDAATIQARFREWGDVHVGAGLLRIATTVHSFKVLKVLIEHVADINGQSEYGVTPLHLAAFYNFADECLALKAAGARADIPDQWHRTALDQAERQGSHECVTALKK